MYDLIGRKSFDEAKFQKKWLVVVDGSQLYSGSRQLNDKCLERYYNRATEEETVNYHCHVLEAKIIFGEKLIISLGSEFIENNGEDGERQKEMSEEIRKQDCYRFLNETSYNWSKFLLLLAVKVTTAFDSLTRPERVKVLILDDSVIKRNRSKTVELLARVFDHVEHKCQKGFSLLTLGWSDGYSFIPTGFNMLSSAKKSNHYNEVCSDIAYRKNGYKFRKESMMYKTDAAILLIKNALNAGIKADYVLMDTWFTTEPMIKEIA